jgi:hypothetical protein
MVVENGKNGEKKIENKNLDYTLNVCLKRSGVPQNFSSVNQYFLVEEQDGMLGIHFSGFVAASAWRKRK